MGFALMTAACTGPGLEPPYEGAGRSAPSTSAPQVQDGPNAGLPIGDGANGPAARPPAAAAGSGGTATMQPASPATTPPPAAMPSAGANGGLGAPTGTAGAAGQMMTPTMPGDPSTQPDGGGAMPPPDDFPGLDFVPECPNETAHALMAEGACSFPLPDGLAVDAELASIALVSNGQFTSVERVAGPFACDLLTGGFYFDMADPPTRITLCPQSCLRAGTAAEMQVVLVLSCPPPAMP